MESGWCFGLVDVSVVKLGVPLAPPSVQLQPAFQLVAFWFRRYSDVSTLLLVHHLFYRRLCFSRLHASRQRTAFYNVLINLFFCHWRTEWSALLFLFAGGMCDRSHSWLKSLTFQSSFHLQCHWFASLFCTVHFFRRSAVCRYSLLKLLYSVERVYRDDLNIFKTTSTKLHGSHHVTPNWVY